MAKSCLLRHYTACGNMCTSGNIAAALPPKVSMMISEQIHERPVKTSSRPAADFDSYVLRYSKAQRSNILLSVTGIGAIVGAITNTHGAPMVMLVSFGLGLAAAGLAALAIAERAHARYTEHLSTATVTTYATEPTAAPVRAFIPSANGAPTVRAGKFRLTRQQWTRLFQTAGDGGKLTRDNAMRALPRELYRDWANTLDELRRLGIVDDNGVITPDGWSWYSANVSPYSTDALSTSGAQGTHAPARTASTAGQGVGVAS